jgi:hypothetical protein
VTERLVPAGTPSDVVVTAEARSPIPVEQSDLGIPVALAPLARIPPHRLVALGDSITHGFKSFAIADTHLAWPALVAATAGFDDFRTAHYPGPAGCPGLPLNLEAALRRLQAIWPTTPLDALHDVEVLARLRGVMDEVEDYWERGDGARLLDDDSGPIPHNLAIWGWDIRDALSKTRTYCRTRIEHGGHRDDLLMQLPSAAGDRSALPVLRGGGPNATPVELARLLGAEGDPGIETLVVALGANNILGTVIAFEVHWSTDETYRNLDTKITANAWRPTHFHAELHELADAVEQIAARHVIWLTVPHVTIAPMLRGVGLKMPGSRYFARYTRPWISDTEFDADRHPCLPADQVRVIDSTIDQYNDMIVAVVRARREAGRDWRVLDIAGILDRLAYRRYVVEEEARPPWWTPYPLPAAYDALSPRPDSRFFASDRFGRLNGGLFALDGIHPTTIGYGILAGEALRVMHDSGVQLANDQPDFAGILAADTLVSTPPTGVSSVLHVVGLVHRAVDLIQALRGGHPI